MSDDPRTLVTGILEDIAAKSVPKDVPEQLLPAVYAELRRLAGGYLKRERSGHTLQPTELVHEAYLRLVDQTRVEWQGRTHFFAVAANAMRRLLVDHARKRSRDKRGGDPQRVTLHEEIRAVPGFDCDLEDLITLDDALADLARLDERQAKIVEMRCFAGLKVDEVAAVLAVSKRTVEGDWTHARAWLKRRLSEEATP